MIDAPGGFSLSLSFSSLSFFSPFHPLSLLTPPLSFSSLSLLSSLSSLSIFLPPLSSPLSQLEDVSSLKLKLGLHHHSDILFQLRTVAACRDSCYLSLRLTPETTENTHEKEKRGGGGVRERERESSSGCGLMEQIPVKHLVWS